MSDGAWGHHEATRQILVGRSLEDAHQEAPARVSAMEPRFDGESECSTPAPRHIVPRSPGLSKNRANFTERQIGAQGRK
ncbi:hypothetical protein RRG08_027179 [Elysia crispata]|uniref:Uncharacterized protein n=1 Tax=Elysia crispata TaxID=231223 RepID=A0AAE1CQ34_9GAST|nr:hypothetical protein RRG08_027179 [Elysia crispata]